ncbi:hypothetical protein M1271_06690 [Patescibacteria group bacterium]|nr:hypothetical protein [Patescibacteria group bacterium]MCL5798386.1 hypothetical protein [Patescibacteria group bacterium]
MFPKIRFVIVILLFICFLILLKPIHAFASFDTLGNQLQDIYKSSLPLEVMISPIVTPTVTSEGSYSVNKSDFTVQSDSGNSGSIFDFLKPAIGYKVNNTLRIPQSGNKYITTDLQSSIINLIGGLSEFIRGLLGYSNQFASEFVERSLPPCTNLTAVDLNNSECGTKESSNTTVNTQSVGIFDTKDSKSTENGLDTQYCLNLPFGVGNCTQSNVLYTTSQSSPAAVIK